MRCVSALAVFGLAAPTRWAGARGGAPDRAGAAPVIAALMVAALAGAAPVLAAPDAATVGTKRAVVDRTGVAAAAPVTGNPVAAVWRERQIDFVYPGRTARYSCDGLSDKVRAMLLDLGARRDVRVVAVGCEDEDHLRVIFSAPALPDAAAKPLRVGDLAATDARFEPFTIAGDAFRNMGIGDCELVQEFTRQVLPTLVTRDVRQDITCVPVQQGGGRFLVRGEILKTLPWSPQPPGRRTGRQ